MTFDYFTKQLSQLNEAISVSGKTKYQSIQISGDCIYYTRKSTGKRESLLLEELFNLASQELVINTTIAKKYISGRKYSPACAILIAAGISKYLK